MPKERFIGKDSEGNEIFSYSEELVSELLTSSGVGTYQMDTAQRLVLLSSREDFHRFLIGVGMIQAETEDGKEVLDAEGVIVPKFADNPPIYMVSSSGYGQPFQTHPVFFLLGDDPPWEIRANHRVGKTEIINI